MKRMILPAFAILLAAIAIGEPLGAAPPSGGTMSIETAGDAADPQVAPFVVALRDALSARGFTVLDQPGHAAYVAQLVLSRADAGTGSAKVRDQIGPTVSGGTPGGAGAGVTIPLGTGRSTLVTLQRTRLEVRIHKREDPAVVWDGSAATVRPAGTKDGSDETVAAILSQAILRGYPFQPDGEVGVP